MLSSLTASTLTAPRAARLGAARAGRRTQVKVLASGLSPEQQAFLQRKARESRPPVANPQPTRGRSASTPRPSSRQPSVRPSSAAPQAPSYSYGSAPAAAPAVGGLSAEQAAFMERKARESRSPAPVETRGRSAPRPRSASPRPSSRTPAPSAAASYSSAPAASSSSFGYGAPAASAPATSGLSADQAAFMERKARESRSPAPVETRGRSAPRPRSASPRPSSRTPAPAAAAPSASYSYSPAPAAPAAPAAASGLSADQAAFLARKATETRSASPAAAPTRGRSSAPPRASSRPSSATPRPASPTPAYQPPAAAPAPSYVPPSSVTEARAALEKSINAPAAPHPTERAPVAPAPAGSRWPDPAFVAATLAAFPDQGVANPEEARALLDGGYTLLDVRTELESNARGKVRGSICIPCAFARQQFDSSKGQMVTSESDNPTFLAQVTRRFPRKDARILVACGNGRQYSIDVLEALEEEGYTNIVGLQGGINGFLRVFDARLNPKDGRPVARRAMKKLL